MLGHIRGGLNLGARHVVWENCILKMRVLTDVPLVSTQVVHVQGNIYDSLETGKLLPPLISFEHVTFSIKSPFNDPP